MRIRALLRSNARCSSRPVSPPRGTIPRSRKHRQEKAVEALVQIDQPAGERIRATRTYLNSEGKVIILGKTGDYEARA